MSSEPSDPPAPSGRKPKNELDTDYNEVILKMARGLLVGAAQVASAELDHKAPAYRVSSVAATALIYAAAFLCKLVGGETPENEAAYRHAVDIAWQDCKVTEDVLQAINAPAPRGVN